ncbi:MAG: UDP-glucose/GDP-mannose dehydrogenase family protein [Pseudobacteriovorax sp.]|nr:UDP-glucose/GDP-mannose dehydrogenase family protein [Pseudobacteriovorax sp.]
MQVAMVGTGYVGLVSGSCLAEVGHTVTCVDLDSEKIENLRKGISPIFEPGLEAIIERNLAHERLYFTTQLQEALPSAEIVFIAVGTPQGEDGSADLKYVLDVAQSIGRLMTSDLTVVVKSTVPVGTCDLVESVIDRELKRRSQKYSVTVVSNPEFLKEGDAIKDFMKPDRIVVGIENAEKELQFKDLYGPFVLDDIGKLMFMDRRSSELTKYSANAMLATRISFMNEMARLCEKAGANIDKVRMGIGTDPRIGKKFLFSGPGYGGSCFPKDVAALINTGADYGVELEVLNAVSRANERQKAFAAEKIIKSLGSLEGKIVTIWGLAFKPGTDDVREAPAKTVVKSLISKGATVVAHDPEAVPNFAKDLGNHDRIKYVDNSYRALDKSHALVLLTEWGEYRRPNWQKISKIMARKLVFDFRNQYKGEELTSLGFEYHSMGRPDSSPQKYLRKETLSELE